MFGRKKKDEKPKASPKLSKNDVAEKLEAGALRVIVTFEVIGKPKEHVEKALKGYMDNVKKDARITILNEDYADAIEQEDGVFSTFCEAEMLVSELGVLVWLAVNFSPASMEIQEPAEKRVTAAQLNAWLNDLISRLHEVSINYRDVNAKNKKLNESLNALIKNTILTALETGNHDGKELQKKVGIHKDQLQPFLDHLVEKKRIKRAGDTYSLE